MAKDELGNVAAVLRVQHDVDAVAIVADDDLAVIDADVDLLDGRAPALLHAHGVVVRVYKKLVEELEEAGVEAQLGLLKGRASRIDNPSRRLLALHATNIGVGELQDVLPVRVLLVLVGHLCVVVWSCVCV